MARVQHPRRVSSKRGATQPVGTAARASSFARRGPSSWPQRWPCGCRRAAGHARPRSAAPRAPATLRSRSTLKGGRCSSVKRPCQPCPWPAGRAKGGRGFATMVWGFGLAQMPERPYNGTGPGTASGVRKFIHLRECRHTASEQVHRRGTAVPSPPKSPRRCRAGWLCGSKGSCKYLIL